MNGRYATFQCTTIQEPFVMFRSVPIPDDQTIEDLTFAATLRETKADLRIG